MDSTPASLFDRLRDPRHHSAWDELVTFVTPLLFYWARKRGLADTDAADLVQDVFQILVQELPHFEYDRNRSFRGWLRTVTLNRLRNTQRKRHPQPLPPDDSELANLQDTNDDEFWSREYFRQLVVSAMERIRTEFNSNVWEAFRRCAVDQESPKEVAIGLGMSVGAVYVAKSRVLARLRQELAGLLD